MPLWGQIAAHGSGGRWTHLDATDQPPEMAGSRDGARPMSPQKWESAQRGRSGGAIEAKPAELANMGVVCHDVMPKRGVGGLLSGDGEIFWGRGDEILVPYTWSLVPYISVAKSRLGRHSSIIPGHRRSAPATLDSPGTRVLHRGGCPSAV